MGSLKTYVASDKGGLITGCTVLLKAFITGCWIESCDFQNDSFGQFLTVTKEFILGLWIDKGYLHELCKNAQFIP